MPQLGALLPFVFVGLGGFTYSNSLQKKGTLILTSLLEDLANHQSKPPTMLPQKQFLVFWLFWDPLCFPLARQQILFFAGVLISAKYGSPANLRFFGTTKCGDGFNEIHQ